MLRISDLVSKLCNKEVEAARSISLKRSSFVILGLVALLSLGFLKLSYVPTQGPISFFANFLKNKVQVSYREELTSHLIESDKSFLFNHIERPFSGKLDLDRVSELSAEEFKSQILTSIPKRLSKRLERYLDYSLEVAQSYGVDPFWLLAIMWTESHFFPKATSHKDAVGLMQILPSTGIYLSQKLNVEVEPSRVRDLLYTPEVSIELGALYLKELLNRFDNNYKWASIAYNMGPGRLSRILKKYDYTGNDNSYYQKVSRYYSFLSRNFLNYTKNEPRAFKKTFVAMQDEIIHSLKRSSSSKEEDFLSQTTVF